jgi:hypothetical protein
MTTLTIDNAIFSTLRADPSVNPAALQRFVAIANSNPAGRIGVGFQFLIPISPAKEAMTAATCFWEGV